MTKKQTNPEKETKEVEKMHEYLKARKEIFDFAINRNVRNVILYYLGIISVIIWLGAGSYIDYKVKGRVEKKLSEKIDEEYTYLSERNTITELGDMAISTYKIRYYEEINEYLSSKKSERIRIAAKAEILRIESYLSTWGYSGLSFNPYIAKERELSAEQLIELYKETDSFDIKITTLFWLTHNFNKEVPDFLLNIAESTDNLRLRYISLCSLQRVLMDFTVDRLDYDKNFELWINNKENFCRRIDESEKKLK